jgi:transcriptional regulator with XRE-family HTH domain
MLAADTGISEGTIMKIEEGRTVMVGDWQEKVCAVLKVPTWLLTVPVRRWVQVVRESGLSATHAVVVKGGGE